MASTVAYKLGIPVEVQARSRNWMKCDYGDITGGEISLSGQGIERAFIVLRPSVLSTGLHSQAPDRY